MRRYRMQGHKKQFCTFYISNRLFGVNILYVREIIDEIRLTPIYHAPDSILGFINIRGQVHLILDLRLILNFEKKAIDETSRVLLFNSSVGESFGVLVDQIGHMVEVDEKQIEYRITEETPIVKNYRTAMSVLETGVCKLQNSLMTILNAELFLNTVNCEIEIM